MATPTKWHRYFGMILKDFFTGTDYDVEIEMDLSHQQQFLDIVVVRKGTRPLDRRLPDGLEDLADHNLITFKSYQEALDDWTLKELTGHYVNYRKQVSPSPDNLLGEDKFRLFGVCARYPQGLARQIDLEELKPGVYRGCRGTDRIDIIVSNKLSEAEHNAMMYLFSPQSERIQYGARHYSQHSPFTSSMVQQLLARYLKEGVEMPYTLEDFQREFKKEFLEGLSDEERLEGIPEEKRLEGIPLEKRLEGISEEELLERIPPETLQKMLEKLKEAKGDSEG